MNKKIKQKKQKMKEDRKDMWKNREHPKGMLGKKQSEKWKEEQSKRLKEQYSSGKRVSSFKGNSYWKGKKRPSLIGNTHGFKKGNVPWNKDLPKEDNPLFGRKYSEEHKVNLSLGRKGKGLGNKPWNKGEVGVQESNKKGKTFEEIYGEKRTKKIKDRIKENRAKQIFPVKDTSIEVKIQDFLKQLNIEFFTHQYMKEIEHSYQCDILIPIQNGINQKTIIECFGNYWHKFPIGRKVDIQRCSELREKGWRVLTFWESEIKPMQLDNLQEKLLC